MQREIKMKFRLAWALPFVAAPVSALAGFNFNSTTVWQETDANLGISGYTIEDFEDTTLVAGLQVSVTSPNGNLAQTSTLPNTFKPADDAFGTAFTLGGGGVWDGDHGIINTRTNQTFHYGEAGSWGHLTFHFTGGVKSAGFSLQQVDRDANVVVNGVSIGSLYALAPSFAAGNGRQGYVRIDATGSDVINTLSIQDAFGFGDGYMFDHVSFVPEPATLATLSLGALIAVRKRRK